MFEDPGQTLVPDSTILIQTAAGDTGKEHSSRKLVARANRPNKLMTKDVLYHVVWTGEFEREWRERDAGNDVDVRA